MTDPIADLFTRIRNAYMAHHHQLSLPHSKLREQICRLLAKEGYLDKITVNKDKNLTTLLIKLRYVNNLPAITNLKRVSKPGRRWYVRSDQIKPVLAGQGIALISTSQGLLTDKQARAQNIGGELICQVW
jgi:small subunit ribosomal protein S8